MDERPRKVVAAAAANSSSRRESGFSGSVGGKVSNRRRDIKGLKRTLLELCSDIMRLKTFTSIVVINPFEKRVLKKPRSNC